ncbi:hypothetical protein [Mesorhizobium sp. IMUNJ 23232]|uniref:hypothetical protein n=1 Tax=Mesorhizobium sp. IMUNJ 23232 TaxID=3376064 RepID=UPI0037A333CD
MARQFDRTELLAAFDEIGEAAQRNGALIHVAVYGGSALMLASNFRFSSEDVDIAELPTPWPQWLADVVATIAARHGWSEDWLNDAVSFHLSSIATMEGDHVEFGTFPRSDEEPGLVVYVPSAEYLLALKVKAVRVLDPLKGQKDAEDIRNLMRVVGVENAAAVVEIMSRYFPRSAADPEKQLFLLRHVLANTGAADAPRYPVGNV